jgi:hypothetical protein
MFDKREFPGTPPLLQALLPNDRRLHAVVEFNVHQAIDAIPLGKTWDRARAVFANPAGDVRGYSDIDCAVALAGQDVSSLASSLALGPAFAGTTD